MFCQPMETDMNPFDFEQLITKVVFMHAHCTLLRILQFLKKSTSVEIELNVTRIN